MSEPAFDIHQLQDMDYVEEKWQQWSDENKSTKFDAVSEEELKENIIKDLSFVSQMSVQEYTLYATYFCNNFLNNTNFLKCKFLKLQ